MKITTEMDSTNVMEQNFKFPKDIKNDLIYCQRALKAHIKVHQMVVDIFEQEEDADPGQMKCILEEIETELYEINAEQHFLFLRLRRVIDEFFKMVKKNGFQMDQSVINLIIAQEVIPNISDESVKILPLTVSFRNTEEKLIKKYFEVQKEKKIFEIIDSDEEAVVIVEEKLPLKNKKDLVNIDIGLETKFISKNGNLNNESQSLSQMSLLKPMAQRLVKQTTTTKAANFPDATQFLQMCIVEDRADSNLLPGENKLSIPEPIKLNATEKQEAAPIELPVSKNVKMSRLNLRQALNRARSENMAAKVAANLLARSSLSLPVAPKVETKSQTQRLMTAPAFTTANRAQLEATSTSISVTTKTSPPKKSDIKTRATRNHSSATAALAAVTHANANTKSNNATTKSSELNSSSEDSNPEREIIPSQIFWPHEYVESRTQAEHYGQEMFLRFFNLFTPEVLVQMQQRRSKRKRRNVHSNERADFHYGRIEYVNVPVPEKKRKAFLLSPQVKRSLQSKRPKRSSAEAPSRSSSSSPDEKRCCNECLKSGGCLDQCNECKGFYHQECHREEDDVNNKKELALDKSKLCPACQRTQRTLLKKEAEQYHNLHSAAQELEKKMAKEKHRRSSLQQESKLFKIQMRNLFNIVNTIKSDQENDSSE